MNKDKKDVVIYTTPGCHNCQRAKDFLADMANITTVDLSKNPNILTFLVEKTGQRSAPIIKIGETYISGFDKIKVIEALES